MTDHQRSRGLVVSVMWAIPIAVVLRLAANPPDGTNRPALIPRAFDLGGSYDVGTTVRNFAYIGAVLAVLQLIAALTSRAWLLATAAFPLFLMAATVAYVVVADYSNKPDIRARSVIVLCICALVQGALFLEALFGAIEAKNTRKRLQALT